MHGHLRFDNPWLSVALEDDNLVIILPTNDLVINIPDN